MAAPTLSWTLNPDRGTINFGRLVPFAGNTYDFTLAGGVYGQTYTAYVMSDDGLKCLAKSTFTNNTYTIPFNTADLRNEFVRDMHEMRSFHCVIRDSEKCVAEGDIVVAWNPLWTDIETGEVYTMRGPQGKAGEPGKQGSVGRTGMSAYDLAVLLGYTGTQEEWLDSLRGQPGNTIMVQGKDAQGEATNYWYKVYAKQNYLGEWRMVLDQTPYEYDPDTNDYVTRTGPQTVDGIKTFTSSPIIPTIETADTSEDAEEGDTVIDTDDDSTKAANTKWVTAKITAWWNALKSGAASVTGLWSFTGIAVKDNNSTNVFAVDPSNAQTSASKLAVTGNETIGGNLSVTGTTTLTGAIDFGDGIFDLFETKWLDYAKEDTGKWRKYNASGFSSSVFPAAYNHLKNDYDNGTNGQDLVKEVLNGTCVKRCIFRDGMLTGFDSESYFSFMAEAFNPQNNPWEAQIKFKTPTSDKIASTNYCLFGNLETSDDGFTLEYRGASGKLAWWMNGIGSAVTGTNTIAANTWYWAKIVFDGEKYVLSISTDGTTWVQDSQVVSSSAINAKKWVIGQDYDSAPATNFTIDLRETRIAVSGTDTWNGTTRTYVPYKLAADGHKIVAIADVAAVNTAYETNAIAWYWVLDVANTKFYVPRTKWGFVGVRTAVGGYVAPGLPEHKHLYHTSSTTATAWNTTNAGFMRNPTSSDTEGASISNPIYGASDTVQPPASEMYLYFFLGR